MEKKNRQLLGTVVNIFVEGPHSEKTGQWLGRTDQDKRVIFSSQNDFCGRFVKAKLLDLRYETFRGELV